MRSLEYTVLERIVCQRTPETYKRESSYLAYEQLSALLENSRQSWADVEQVYQFCERRKALTGRAKTFEVVGVYLQCKDGKMDYKYMQGLTFLVPIADATKEIVDFMRGGWNNER